MRWSLRQRAREEPNGADEGLVVEVATLEMMARGLTLSQIAPHLEGDTWT